MARFAAPEFTSLCPITGQPDFAHLVIDYVAQQVAAREQVAQVVSEFVPQHGAFHEDCTVAYRPASGPVIKGRIGCVLVAIGIHAAGFPSTCFWHTGKSAC